MKLAFTIIGVVVVLIMFGTMLTGIQEAQTDERVDEFAGVSTGVGDDDADVVLVTDIFDNDILNVSGITSDNANDAPLPDVYTPSTNTLTVRGLEASASRTLSVTYLYGALNGQAEATNTFLGIVPIFVGIGIVVILVGVIVAAFANRNR